MGSALSTDSIPILVTMIDVHNVRAQDQFYFANVSTGGASTKVIGRSQTLSVEVGLATIVTVNVYACPDYVFSPENSRNLGSVSFPVERLAERYSSGIFQQWFNLECQDVKRPATTDPQQLASRFEQSYEGACSDIYQPKICLSIIGSAFEVQRGGRDMCSIFVGEDVKTQAGPDLKALIASHKQQSAYIDSLHEELRRLNMASYRPASTMVNPVENPRSVQGVPAMLQSGQGMTQVLKTGGSPVVGPGGPQAMSQLSPILRPDTNPAEAAPMPAMPMA